MTLSRGELDAALDVFEKWLEEEAQAAMLSVGEGLNAKTSTLPELAELAGLARGLSAAPDLLRARIRELQTD